MPTPITDIKLRDPDSTLDYTIEWADWIPPGDSLASVSMSCSPTPTIISSTTPPAVSGTRVVVWLTGGVAGTVYSLLCRVTTTGGRTDERTVQVRTVSR